MIIIINKIISTLSKFVAEITFQVESNIFSISDSKIIKHFRRKKKIMMIKINYFEAIIIIFIKPIFTTNLYSKSNNLYY